MGAVVTACTWFSGNAVLAESHLRVRLAEIMVLNPWLQGRLIRKRTRYSLPLQKGRLYLEYRAAAASNLVDSIFSVADDSSIASSISYQDNYPSFENYVALGGEEAIDRRHPIFRVSLVRVSPHEFALIESLNHCVGDGHTLYQLHDMLSLAAEPRALVVERHAPFLKELLAVTGGDTAVSFATYMPAFLRNVLRGYVNTITIKVLSNESILEAQRNALLSGEVPFVSSNDVIMSWLSNTAAPDLTLMVVGFRDRISSLSASHAGNYVGLIPLLPHDFATPAAMRRCVGNVPLRRISHPRRLPGMLTFSPRCMPHLSQPCMVTSWVSFYSCDLDLPGADIIRHQPIVSGLTKLAARGHLGGLVKLAFDGAIIFRPRAASISVMYLGDHLSMTAARLEALS